MRFWISAASLLLCALFGGGGAPAPLMSLVAQAGVLIALCCWIALVRPSGEPIDRWMVIGAALFASVSLIQLVPLPPSIWQALPGREVEVEALGLLGQEESWRPVSLMPFQTLASALSLIPPLIVLYFISRLSIEERSRILGVLVIVALLTALLGAMQLAGSEAAPMRLYQTTHLHYATGFQANRNSTADVLLIGLLALAGLAAASYNRLRGLAAKLLVVAIGALFLLAILVTGSRMGMALAAGLLGVIGIVTIVRMGITRRVLIAAGTTAALMLVTALALVNNAAVNRSLGRFGDLRDTRPEVWADTLFAAQFYWPVGSGVGTFRQTFMAAERLEAVDPSIANRAHNEFLEFSLEAGILGWIVVLICLIGIAIRIVRLWRTAVEEQRRQIEFGVATLILLGLHSLVDYPLRSVSIAVIAAVAVAMFTLPGQVIESASEREAPRAGRGRREFKVFNGAFT